MEPVTSSSDSWDDALEADAGSPDVNHRLQAAADRARKEFGAGLWFAEILGRRWSHIAGTGSEDVLSTVTQRIPLAGGIGLVVANWGSMDKGEQDAFLEAVKRLL